MNATTTNPVLAALAQARMRAAPMFAKMVRTERRFLVPAAPADVARFVADCASLGIERLWPAVQEISKMHVSLGLADPTLGGVAAAAINDVAGIAPPRSWPNDRKLRFSRCPMICRSMSRPTRRSAKKRCGARRTRPPSPGRNLAWHPAEAGMSRQMTQGTESSKPMNLTRTPPLEDRIKQIRAEIDAIIDAKAEAVARQSPGVPLGVIRNLLTARAPACRCAQYLEIADE